jgi:serine/threonine protein kinase
MLPVSPYEVSVLASKLEGDADLPDFLDPSHYSAYGVGLSTAVEEPKPVTVISLFSRILLIIEAMLIRIAAFVAVLMAILYWLNKAGIPIPFPSSVMEKLKLVLQSKLRSFVTGDPSLAMQGLVNIELESQRLAMQLQKQRLGAGAEEEDDMEEFDADGNRVQRVGSLMLSSHVLGYGSQGTVVFKGCLNGRPVAVKRMLAQFSRAAEREMNLLIRSDGHANVVRYFLKEQKGEFVYLALQLCKMSLRDFVLKLQRHQNSTQAALRASAAAGNNAYAALGSTGSSKVPGAKTSSSGSVTVDEIPEEARLALLQIAEGVAHLHSQRIVHRDIKPHNILCALPDDQIERNEGGELLPATITTPRQLGDFILKISDMGLSKQLDREEDSFASMSMPFPHLAASTTMPSNGSSLSADEGGDGSGAGGDKQADNSPVGTIGWQAPELMALRGTGAIPEEEEEDDDEDEDVDEDAAEDECDSDGARQAPEHSNGIENASDCSTTMTGAAAASSSSSSSSVAAKNESSPEDSMPAINGDAHGRGVGVNVGVESDNIPLKSIKNANRRSLVDQRRDRRRRTQTVDIFSLGCVFHYVLVPGVHPFGQWFEREPNIMTGKANLMQLKLVPDALDLIERMLQKEPSDRPSAAEVCKHPFFWSAQKRLDFFVELSDFLEHESVNAPVVIAMEANGSAVVGRSWDRKLHASLLEDMNRYRKYDTASVRDLLRVIRNKRHHFHELTDSVKHVVGNMPAGFVSYFESRFPTLIMHCVRVACQYLSQEKDIKPFCGGITGLFESKDKDRDGSRVLQEMASGDGDTRGNGPTAGGHGSSSSGSTSNHPRGDDGAGLTADAAAGAGAGPVQSEDSIAETHAHLLASGVVVWQGSAIAASSQCRGWWRESSTWTAPPTTTRHRPQHVTRSATDPRYRSRLCTHWEGTEGTSCPMRKKGKCDFAHGPLELRVKESRRDKWALRSSSGVGLAGDLEGQLQCGPCSSGSGSGSGLTAAMALRMSGGEDVLGAARSIEKVRAAEGSISEFERTSVNRKHHQQTPRKR